MAQAVAMPQGAAWGRPERATDPQAAWRTTRNNLVRSCGYVGISSWFLGNEWGSTAASRFNASRGEQSGGELSAMAGRHVQKGSATTMQRDKCRLDGWSL